jgi:hypothetical protein
LWNRNAARRWKPTNSRGTLMGAGWSSPVVLAWLITRRPQVRILPSQPFWTRRLAVGRLPVEEYGTGSNPAGSAKLIEGEKMKDFGKCCLRKRLFSSCKWRFALGVILTIMCWDTSLFAKGHPSLDYQDGVLVSFQTFQSGSSCRSSGTVEGEEDSSGSVKGTTQSTTVCSNNTVRHYIIAVSGHRYVIEPSWTKKKAAMGVATLGWSALFEKKSVLADLLPGTHVLVRTNETGFYVKVGKRESRYIVLDVV